MNQISLQYCAADGSYGALYTWFGPTGKWMAAGQVASDALSDGVAVCFNCKVEGISIQVSGEVEINPWSTTLPLNFSLVGNMTPVEMSIQDIIPYSGDAKVTGVNMISIQKCATDGSYGTLVSWFGPTGKWMEAGQPSTMTLKPGEACCANNKIEGLKLKFKSPIAE